MPKLDFGIDLKPKTAPVVTKPRRPPGRPTGKAKTPAAPEVPQSSYNVLLDNNSLVGYDMKSKITLKELKFIEIYLVGGIKEIDAIKLAGYESKSDSYLYQVARKIIEKYESQAGDHRKIFRAIGAGEVAVAQGLLEIAQGPYPADVRRKAWADIASCLGLKSEQVESFQGMSINIRGMTPAEQGIVIEADGQPSKPALPPPFKPSQVTK